jgi:hypothetical protein
LRRIPRRIERNGLVIGRIESQCDLRLIADDLSEGLKEVDMEANQNHGV